MSRVEVTQETTPLSDGILKTDLPLDGTLQVVKDQLNNSSTLLLATDETQVNSVLRINTDASELLDLQDTGSNNRFNINRDVQKINLDFASKPSDLTTIVGAIRTATNGTDLADIVEFRENGDSAILKNLSVGGLINATGFGHKIRVIGQGDASVGIFRNQASSSPAKLEFMKSRGTYDAPVVISPNDQIGNVGFYGYTGSAYGQGASINAIALSTSTGVEGTMKFVVYNNTGSNFDKIGIYKEGVYVGDTVAVPTAQLQIRGKGSTSATTSLLVQNSAGLAALTVKDDLISTFGGDVSINNNSLKLVGSIGNTSAIRIDAASSTGLLRLTTNSVNIGGNTTNNASALLQIDSTTQGFLPPRMTTAQKNAITSPASGLMVYDTTLNKLCVFGVATWETIQSI